MPKTMQDSGVECIGDIPNDWNTDKIKNHYKVISGATPKSENGNYWDGDIDWITPADYKTADIYIKSSKRKITMEGLNSCGTELVPIDSIIVSNRAPIGSVALNGMVLCTNQGCKSLVLKDAKAVNKFVYYYLSVMPEILNMFGRGTTFLELSSFDLSNFQFPMPSVDIQQRAICFLDQKCAEIDNIITQTTLSIEEYKKYKQSLITEAVTKGLNPNVEVKDSGVEWIGEIPRHWDIRKTTSIFSNIGSGTTPKSNDEKYYDGTISWIQSGDINGGVITETNKKITEIALNDFTTLKMYYPEFIVIAMYGASIANASISTIEACVNQACCVLGNTTRNLRYIFYNIKAMKEYLPTLASGGTQPNISQDIIRQLRMPTPPLVEQINIANFLDQKCSEIDNLIAQKQSLLAELEYYKKSLIYECVTGKREVN